MQRIEFTKFKVEQYAKCLSEIDHLIPEIKIFIALMKEKNFINLPSIEDVGLAKAYEEATPRKNRNDVAKSLPGFILSNSDIYFSLTEKLKLNAHYVQYYMGAQNRVCLWCGSNIFHDSYDLVFIPRYDDAFQVSFSPWRKLHNTESSILPIISPYSQILMCHECSRGSRYRIIRNKSEKIASTEWETPPKEVVGYFPYDHIVCSNGYIYVCAAAICAMHLPYVDNKYNNWGIIYHFNLNRDSLVSLRKKSYSACINSIKKVLENKVIGDAQFLLSGRSKDFLTRFSAVMTRKILEQDPDFSDNQKRNFVSSIFRYYYTVDCHVYDNEARAKEDADTLSEIIEDIKGNRFFSRYVDKIESCADQKSLLKCLAEIFIDFFASNFSLEYDSEGYRLNGSHLSCAAHPPRFIRKFEITNYRGFSTDKPINLDAEKGEAAALPPLPNAAFLADNAGGKTRILQALAWALMGRADVESLLKPESDFPPYLLPSYTVSGAKEKTTIKIWFFDRPENEHLEVVFPAKFGPKRRDYRRSLTTGRGGRKAYEDRIPFLPFGSNRSPSLLRGGTVSDILSPCLHSLFFRDKHVPHPLSLVGFNELLELGKSHGEIVVQTLLNVLLDCGGYGKKAPGVTVKNENGTIAFFYGGNEFDCLSEGLQAVATLAIYILLGLKAEMKAAATGCSEDFTSSMAGIVLMDELDAHLHPRWRRQILRQLRVVFPNVQFLFTTHDPVVLRGMPARNVLRIEPPTDQSGKCGVHRLSETGLLAGYEIDDLLISMLFNLDSTRDDHDRDGYREYFQLAVEYANEKLTNPDKENKFLSDRLDHLREIYGAERLGLRHPTDRLLLPALDLLLGEEINTKSLQSSPADSSSPESAPSSPAEDIKNILVQLWSL